MLVRVHPLPASRMALRIENTHSGTRHPIALLDVPRLPATLLARPAWVRVAADPEPPVPVVLGPQRRALAPGRDGGAVVLNMGIVRHGHAEQATEPEAGDEASETE